MRNSSLTLRPLSRAEVRDVDRQAIDEFRVPGIVLMENAGRGAAELIAGLGGSGPVTICAGKGNNGGDGFVIARHLDNRGFDVRVIVFCDSNALEGDAATNYQVLRACGLRLIDGQDERRSSSVDAELRSSAWIVDALLGTGAQGAVREPIMTAIESINHSGTQVIAVDLPSGLDCDTGRPLGVCVRATHTATFVAPKTGFAAPDAAPFLGTVHIIDIGAPRALLQRFAV